MLLKLPKHLAARYKSKSQIARVTTEAWATKNFYCPACAQFELQGTPANTKVFDFYCRNCREQFQLKSKARRLGSSLKGAHYKTTLDAIKSGSNPSVIVLVYCPQEYVVLDVRVIHRRGIREDVIKACKPLAAHARRAGWQGCDYMLNKVRKKYVISVVRKSSVRVRLSVAKQFQRISNNAFRPVR